MRSARLLIPLIISMLLAPVIGAAASKVVHAGRHAAMAPPVCRFCKMKMTTAPTGMMRRRCKFGGRYYYCCTQCGPHQTTAEMSKAMAAKAHRGRILGGRMTGRS